MQEGRERVLLSGKHNGFPSLFPTKHHSVVLSLMEEESSTRTTVPSITIRSLEKSDRKV